MPTPAGVPVAITSPQFSVIPFEIEESDALGEALTQISERKVSLKVVTRGERAQYLQLANKNALNSVLSNSNLKN